MSCKFEIRLCLLITNQLQGRRFGPLGPFGHLWPSSILWPSEIDRPDRDMGSNLLQNKPNGQNSMRINIYFHINKRYMPTVKKIVTKALPLSVPNRLV